MSEVLEKAKALREQAKSRTASADRKRLRSGKADYSEPIGILGEAIKLLLADLEKSGARGGDAAAAEAAPGELAGLLADCYGMLGGIHRRAGDYDASISAYDEGKKYEREPAYDVQNSYNITNSIAVRILKDPRNLSAQKAQIDEAIEFIWNQVNGKRNKQWWAWADLGELRLLAGRADDASQAYREFKEGGPRARDYESTISVLDELARSVAAVDAGVAEAIASTISSLNKDKPSV